MKSLRFVVSLTTSDNDYQLEQANVARQAANRSKLTIEILYAENDAIQQSQQLLKTIQTKTTRPPDGIVFEPVGGTALPHVARAAAAAGIACVVLNREADYLAELHREFHIPAFSISSDHTEIGRIQGRQLAALLPAGGTVLLIQGPAESLAAKQRTAGMYETKPIGVQVKIMKGNWTEASAQKAIASWMKLPTSQENELDVVAAQNDAMAIGARKAFQQIAGAAVGHKYLRLPFLGIDGLPATGQAWVNGGLLSATVVVPLNADRAVELLAHALRTGAKLAENTFTAAASSPPLEELAKKSPQSQPTPKNQSRRNLAKAITQSF